MVRTGLENGSFKFNFINSIKDTKIKWLGKLKISNLFRVNLINSIKIIEIFPIRLFIRKTMTINLII